MAANRFARILAMALGALSLGSAGAAHKAAAPTPGRSLIGLPIDGDWRQLATPVDRDRLRGWRKAWIDALAKAQAGAGAATVAGDPSLFDPDRALPGAVPPPGAYRCHVFKLGAHGTAMRDFTAYPAIDCRVGAESAGGAAASSLYAISGGQRPVGLIFPDAPSRAVFLGTMVLGDETKPLRYGQDANRDLAGYVERIGEARWRLVLPRPRFESVLDIVEIVPARGR